MAANQDGPAPRRGGGSNAYQNVTCPFCGFLCDDLEVMPEEKGLRVSKNACALAIKGFERPVGDTTPKIGGKPATLEQAIAAAAEIVRTANLPLFGGLATDVEGVRAALAIAERAGGVFDHAYSDSLFKNFRVLQSSGYFMSTLTETRNRADLIVIVGTDLQKVHPRFFERIVNVEHSILADHPAKRTVVFLGKGLDQSAAAGPRVGELITAPCPPDRVGEVVAAIRAAINGRALSADDVAGVPAAQIRDLAERFKAASYGVMVWSSSSLAFPNADLTVLGICDLVKELNRTTRFAGLSVGGSEGSPTATAVSGWTTGFPMRVSFAGGKPEYDQYRYGISRMLGAGEGDALVWIASISNTVSPPSTKVPTVVLGTPDLELPSQPHVFIPVGTPGLDHSGRLVRCDSAVTIYLRGLGRADLPRVADVLTAIEASL